MAHLNKKKILRNILKSYIDVHKTKKEVLKTLEKSKKPLETTEIAKLNRLKRPTTLFHLDNLLKDDKIKKIKGKPTRWFKNYNRI